VSDVFTERRLAAAKEFALSVAGVRHGRQVLSGGIRSQSWTACDTYISGTTQIDDQHVDCPECCRALGLAQPPHMRATRALLPNGAAALPVDAAAPSLTGERA